jgi:hypothetical protein
VSARLPFGEVATSLARTDVVVEIRDLFPERV